MKTAHIIATGPSSVDYKYHPEHHVIGINAARSIAPCNVLLIQDSPYLFTEEKMKHITSAECLVLINAAFYDLWKACGHFTSARANAQPIIMDIWDSVGVDTMGIYPAGVDSAFTATAYAIKKGYKKVVVWGADYTGHPEHKNNIERISKQWKELSLYARKSGILLLPGSPQMHLLKNMLRTHNNAIFE